MVSATSNGSDQPAHTRRLIRAFASRLNITEHRLEFLSLSGGYTHRGLKICFLSDFRPREECYVLLNDENSTIKRFGKKMLKSSITKCFFYESVRSKFSFFFSFYIFSRFFWIDLKRRPLGIRKK